MNSEVAYMNLTNEPCRACIATDEFVRGGSGARLEGPERGLAGADLPCIQVRDIAHAYTYT